MYQQFIIGITCGVTLGFLTKHLIKKHLKCRLQKNAEAETEATKTQQVSTGTDTGIDNDEEYKVALVVNNELKMTAGKILAQCGHAVIGVYEKYYEQNKDKFTVWERQGQAITVYKAGDEKTLKLLYDSAKKKHFYTYIVQDAGRTQISAGSRTVLIIGPEKATVVKSMVGHLPLY